MPIQIIMSEGLVSPSEAQQLHADVAQTFLDIHGISDNAFMIPNVIGEVVFINPELAFAGKKTSPIAIVELKVPSFTFPTQDIKNQFVTEVTQLVSTACKGNLPINSIWVNAVYAIDGLWGIAGKAYSNEELGQAIQSAAG